MALQRILGATLLWHGVIAGLSDPASKRELLATSAPRKLHGRFLHISDIHPDEFYRVHSSTDEDEACHRGKGPAGTYGAETTDCDTPFVLVNATFDWIGANLKDQIDFVVWTGDSARHDSDEEIPRNQAQVLGTNRWIADKFAELFAHPDGLGLEIPVIPTLGNNDILPHNILLPGPNAWLQQYTHIWRHFIPEEQRHSFEFGGWFFVEAIPNKLAIVSLNTLYFFDRNAGVDGCANPSEPGYKQLEWLSVQLQFMRHRGMKAMLMGHVPPARTDSKMMWDETCWQKYTLWLQQYRDVVIAGLYGHMNIDHFLIQDTHDINLALLEDPTGKMVGTRQAMEDELSTTSAADYLQELRSLWSNLTPPPTTPSKSDNSNDDKTNRKKGRKGKKPKAKDPWGERYQLTLVGPSIVPNYFPTLRIIEYNISGLEQAPIWANKPTTIMPTYSEETEQKHLDLRSIDTDDFGIDANQKKKGKKPKKEKPKDPHLVIPDPPAKTSPPGPGYSPQPLSLTGYVQYYANLTYINNLTLDAIIEDYQTEEESWLDWLLKWKNGKHGGKKPVSSKPLPREFYFEVGYSTFTDKTYKLKDLTVNSFVGLAYRMGQTAGKKMVGPFEDGEKDIDDDEYKLEEEEEDSDSGSDSEDDEGEDLKSANKGDKKGDKGKKDKKKKKKKGKKKKQNKTWLCFLSRAFVGTVEKQQLEELG